MPVIEFGKQLAELKLDLIDSNAEMPTRRKQKDTLFGHRERLNNQALESNDLSDAIVRSHTNRKYETLAEMTSVFIS